MSSDTQHQPWRRLIDLLDAGDREALEQGLRDLSALEVVRGVSRLSEDQRSTLLAFVQPDQAAELLDRIPEAQAVDALEHLAPETAARILEELPSDERADLIGEIDEAEAEAILAEMPRVQAEELRALAAYPEGTVGSLMFSEHLRYDMAMTAGEVLADLQQNGERYAQFDVQYGYVCSLEGRLAGVLRLRDLLLARPARPIADLVISNPHRINADADLRDLVAFFDEHRLFGAPVVDNDGLLVGVVRQSAVDHAVADQSEETFRVSQGIVGGEELRSMPVLLRSRRRLAWLSVNVLLNLVAASVIALHQETLQTVIALAVFLPIISDMSGCSGNQAAAVSMRELMLGVITPRDIGRVLVKELTAGLINGSALGLLLGAAAWAWSGNPWLGLVAGGALAINTLVSVCIGGGVPLLLTRLGKDPALASGPLLTTVTDACGFFLTLTLAAATLSHLS